MYADALLSKEDIAKVAKSVPKPLIVNMGLGMRSRKTTPLMSPKQLQDMGVAGVSYPRLLSTAALKGMMNAMAVFKEEVVRNNRVVDRPDLLASFDEMNDLMGMGARRSKEIREYELLKDKSFRRDGREGRKKDANTDHSGHRPIFSRFT